MDINDIVTRLNQVYDKIKSIREEIKSVKEPEDLKELSKYDSEIKLEKIEKQKETARQLYNLDSNLEYLYLEVDDLEKILSDYKTQTDYLEIKQYADDIKQVCKDVKYLLSEKIEKYSESLDAYALSKKYLKYACYTITSIILLSTFWRKK